jgi:hypothetical protein
MTLIIESHAPSIGKLKIISCLCYHPLPHCGFKFVLHIILLSGLSNDNSEVVLRFVPTPLCCTDNILSYLLSCPKMRMPVRVLN